MKSKEELNALKEEVETVSKKLHELTDEELEQVSGGAYFYGAMGLYTNIKCSNPDCIYNYDVQPTGWSEHYGEECNVCHKGIITFEFIPYGEGK